MRLNRKFLSVGAGLGLVVVVIVVIILLQTNRRSSPEKRIETKNEQSAVVAQFSTTAKPLVTVQGGITLPALDFPLGSIEEACNLNEYPAWHDYFDGEYQKSENWIYDPLNAEGDWAALQSPKCIDALEKHLSKVNPFLWSQGTHASQFAFILLDNPLTFGRIFEDLENDLARVQDALSRPECLLEKGTIVSWELKEECHADAFLNYALLNRFCYSDGVSSRKKMFYFEEDNPTPEQDRLMWKQELEDAWIEATCAGFSAELQLTTGRYPELTKLLFAMAEELPIMETLLSKQ